MNNIQQLYQTILKSGLINVSFDDFSKAMLNENYQKTVFEAITQRGLFNNNFDVFKLAYSPQDNVTDIGALKQLQPGDPGYQRYLCHGSQIPGSGYNGTGTDGPFASGHAGNQAC